MANPIKFQEHEQAAAIKNQIKIDHKTYPTVIGLKKVSVGVKDAKISPNTQEVIEQSHAQEVFDRDRITMSNWLFIDLETGKNIKRYFPGSEVHAKTNKDNVLILESASENSPEVPAYVESHSVIEHAGTEIKIFEDCILDPVDGLIKIDQAKMSPQTPAASGWYRIWYNNIVGFIHISEVSDIGYYEPFMQE